MPAHRPHVHAAGALVGVLEVDVRRGQILDLVLLLRLFSRNGHDREPAVLGHRVLEHRSDLHAHRDRHLGEAPGDRAVRVLVLPLRAMVVAQLGEQRSLPRVVVDAGPRVIRQRLPGGGRARAVQDHRWQGGDAAGAPLVVHQDAPCARDDRLCGGLGRQIDRGHQRVQHVARVRAQPQVGVVHAHILPVGVDRQPPGPPGWRLRKIDHRRVHRHPVPPAARVGLLAERGVVAGPHRVRVVHPGAHVFVGGNVVVIRRPRRGHTYPSKSR